VELRWRLPLRAGRALELGSIPGVMAILNVTPDSFSDGGRFDSVVSAVEAGLHAADLGAVVVDVGGESTRPRGGTYGSGAGDVAPEEEIRRVVPVVEGIRKARPQLAISVDTRKPSVARLALQAGADVINVVTGLDPDAELLGLVAEHDAALVLNHCRGTPQNTFEVSRFGDVVEEVAADLVAALDLALASGVSRAKVFLDPGLGFGKNARENETLLANLGLLAPREAPLVVGASRKAFLAGGSNVPAAERLPESLAAVAVAAAEASSRPLLVRVHDVVETTRFLGVLERVGASARYDRE
jgi:dihydropteroate synthase